MEKRKGLSKKIRFEVFKRDSFTCQYCGQKAPDVVLEVDHLDPVSKGGTNDIMNLIASCFDCNRGKGDRKINDGSVVEKQRKQIEDLAQKREQIEMILDWKKSLLGVKDDELSAINDYISELSGRDLHITDSGEKRAKKALRDYGLTEFLECLSISSDRYGDNIEEVLKKSYGIMKSRKMAKEIPNHDDAVHLFNMAKKTWWGYPDFTECYKKFLYLLDSGNLKKDLVNIIYSTGSYNSFLEEFE